MVMAVLASPLTAVEMSMWLVSNTIFGSDFPGVGPGSADSTFAGGGEGFVAKLDANLSSGLQIINSKVNLVVQSTSFNPASVSGGPAGTFTVIARSHEQKHPGYSGAYQGEREDIDQWQ